MHGHELRLYQLTTDSFRYRQQNIDSQHNSAYCLLFQTWKKDSPRFYNARDKGTRILHGEHLNTSCTYITLAINTHAFHIVPSLHSRIDPNLSFHHPSINVSTVRSQTYSPSVSGHFEVGRPEKERMQAPFMRMSRHVLDFQGFVPSVPNGTFLLFLRHPSVFCRRSISRQP